MRSYYDYEVGYLDFEFKDDDGAYFNPDQDSTFYVEVYDAEDVLQAVYTLTTTPAIVMISIGQYRVSDIPLTGFAEGVAYFKVYANKDGAETPSGSWAVCHSGTGRHVHGVWCDPRTSWLYAGVGDTTVRKIIRSRDRGTTWETIASGGTYDQPISMVFTATHRFFGSDRSDDTGNCIRRTADDAVFETVLSLLGSRNCFVWAMTQNGDDLLLAGTQTRDSGGNYPAIYMSPDGGETWSIAKDFGYQAVGNKGVDWMSGFDSAGWFYYHNNINAKTYRARVDAGEYSEEELAKYCTKPWVGPDDLLYGIESMKVWRSDDHGHTWEELYSIPEGTAPRGLFVGKDGIIYVAVNGVGHLRRGEWTGASWDWTVPFTYMGAAFTPVATFWKPCQDKDGNIYVGEYGGSTSQVDEYIWKGAYEGAILPHPYLEHCFVVLPAATSGALCSLEDLKAHLEITDTDQDTFLLKLIGRTAAFMESYCNRKLASQTVTERYTGDRTSRMNLRQFPVTSIASIEDTSDSAMFDYAAADEHTYWECDYDAGILELLYDTFPPWPIKAIEIVYTAGYATIPEDLRQVAIELAAAKFYLKDKQRQGISSKSVGGQTITYAPDELSQAQRIVLDRYARITVGAV